MPSPSELARQDQEKRPLPKAEKFDITIDFGPHQAKLTLQPSEDVVDMANELAKEVIPHFVAMMSAEERNHA